MIKKRRRIDVPDGDSHSQPNQQIPTSIDEALQIFQSLTYDE
jgi:hypothetical protein